MSYIQRNMPGLVETKPWVLEFEALWERRKEVYCSVRHRSNFHSSQFNSCLGCGGYVMHFYYVPVWMPDGMDEHGTMAYCSEDCYDKFLRKNHYNIWLRKYNPPEFARLYNPGQGMTRGYSFANQSC